MRSTLIRTGILREENGLPSIDLRPSDHNIANMLETIENFILSSRHNERISFEDLYDTLRLPEYHIGLRKGLIPIYLAAVIHEYKQQIVILDKFSQVPTTADALLQINSDPAAFSLSYLDWNPQKEAFVGQLAAMFADFVIEAEKGANTYRLALSATLERHRDEEGTAILYNFFGKKCIEYPLERAIAEDKLTPYKYYPVVVHLNEDELNNYEQLSYEMSKCIIKDKRGKYKLNRHGEILALKRARIVAGATEKLDALREQIQPYIHDNNILVYCGATNVLDEHADYSSSDASDVRQIEAVTNILGNELGMAVAQFTSKENMETRAAIKEQFQRGDRLQAIVAIKCLDEGVNIPGIRTAFILASTTNPKEYIQRRGRVLRKAPHKPYAVIYDFVTLPRPLDSVASLTTEQAQRDLALVKNELARIKEFGRLSQNSMDANNLIWDIQEAYHITDESEEGESEYGGN